jgi:putative phosphoribosyl transferase
MSERAVTVDSGEVTLQGTLAGPEAPAGLVLFAHGSGSSRLSPRNRYVAGELNRAGLATLLFDLLTEDEHRRDQATAELRFDIGLLSERLAGAVEWAGMQAQYQSLSLGLFGASTGAAAALAVAADKPERIAAVVSRGGRPDLAGPALPGVRAPTLLLVGGLDQTVLELNRRAAGQLAGISRVQVIPGATHLFEEPGKLEAVAALAARWFERYLR